jgi:hypothetical protein
VRVDIVAAEGESHVTRNLQRKAQAADRMFTALVSHMNDALTIRDTYTGTPEEIPSWLLSSKS